MSPATYVVESLHAKSKLTAHISIISNMDSTNRDRARDRARVSVRTQARSQSKEKKEETKQTKQRKTTRSPQGRKKPQSQSKSKSKSKSRSRSRVLALSGGANDAALQQALREWRIAGTLGASAGELRIDDAIRATVHENVRYEPTVLHTLDAFEAACDEVQRIDTAIQLALASESASASASDELKATESPHSKPAIGPRDLEALGQTLVQETQVAVVAAQHAYDLAIRDSYRNLDDIVRRQASTTLNTGPQEVVPKRSRRATDDPVDTDTDIPTSSSSFASSAITTVSASATAPQAQVETVEQLAEKLLACKSALAAAYAAAGKDAEVNAEICLTNISMTRDLPCDSFIQAMTQSEFESFIVRVPQQYRDTVTLVHECRKSRQEILATKPIFSDIVGSQSQTNKDRVARGLPRLEDLNFVTWYRQRQSNPIAGLAGSLASASSGAAALFNRKNREIAAAAVSEAEADTQRQLERERRNATQAGIQTEKKAIKAMKRQIAAFNDPTGAELRRIVERDRTTWKRSRNSFGGMQPSLPDVLKQFRSSFSDYDQLSERYRELIESYIVNVDQRLPSEDDFPPLERGPEPLREAGAGTEAGTGAEAEAEAVTLTGGRSRSRGHAGKRKRHGSTSPRGQKHGVARSRSRRSARLSGGEIVPSDETILGTYARFMSTLSTTVNALLVHWIQLRSAEGTLRDTSSVADVKAASDLRGPMNRALYDALAESEASNKQMTELLMGISTVSIYPDDEKAKIEQLQMAHEALDLSSRFLIFIRDLSNRTQKLLRKPTADTLANALLVAAALRTRCSTSWEQWHVTRMSKLLSSHPSPISYFVHEALQLQAAALSRAHDMLCLLALMAPREAMARQSLIATTTAARKQSLARADLAKVSGILV